jgi:NADP-dependent 3-hydroxy acid dehydrogenase YdfG
METINGKYILISGATGGIGAEAARLLRQSGARLFLTGRDAARLESLRQELQLPEAQCFAAEISEEAQVAALAARVHALAPQLDVLVNAAGIGIIKPLESLSLAEFRQTLDSNLTGPFLLLKHFLPPMKEAKKGLIINIPGVLGKTPMAGAAAYSASKYGLNGMMKSIREELKRTDIRITNLFLGGVDTPFWDTIDLRVQRDKFIMAREAARAIWFLCQQPSSGVVSEMVIQPFNHQAI